jgi:hypothetical protein
MAMVRPEAGMAMPRSVHVRALLAAGALVVTGRTVEGCGGKDFAFPSHDGGTDATAGAIGDDDGAASGAGTGTGASDGSGVVGSGTGGPLPPGSCTGDAGQPLRCYVDPSCPSGSPTTLKGTVFDPAGKDPVPNVAVFVPNSTPLPPIATGTNRCTSCSTSIGDYVSLALTGADGSFVLTDVPSLTNLPLVVQLGKWRRTIMVQEVADCATTTLPDSGSGQVRLPRSQKEGDMPQIAILTGGADDLGCFLRRVGVDPSEYSAPHAGGRVDVYQGLGTAGSGTGPGGGPPAYGPGLSGGVAGDCTTTSCPLWSSTSNLDTYDLVLLGCEGAAYDQTPDASDAGDAGVANVTPAAKQAMHDWLGQGGRLFAAHDQSAWFQNGPLDFQRTAIWRPPSSSAAACPDCTVDDSFAAGRSLQGWLQAIGLLSDGGTQLPLSNVTDSVSTVNPATTIRWVYDPTDGDTKLLSFATPVAGIDAGITNAAPQYCGKAVFFDLHAGGPAEGDVPGSCSAADLTPDEKLLEYQLFDESICVSDTGPPPPL